MSEAYNNLVKCFDKALEKKEKGNLRKEDVQEIYQAATKLFDGETYLDQKQILQIRDRWVSLAGENLDKGNAMKKLQGTSRAESIRSVLLSSL